MPTRISRVSCSLALALVAALCCAWGSTGHKVVAQIAYDHLTPEARAAVDELLGDSDLPEFSVWADQIKGDKAWEWTKPWHYVNVPEGATGFDMDRDCPDEGCVVRGIERYAEVLASEDATHEERVQALKFLVHFVGDIHQPLHVSNASDLGGNRIGVTLFSRQMNLHSLWDTGMINQMGMPYEVYAARLEEALTPEVEAAAVAEMDPVAWANESHALSMSNAYVDTDGATIKTGDGLGQEYIDRNLPVVDEQLTKAGLRLAEMLNGIFGVDEER